MERQSYRKVSKDGITAAVLNGRNILLLKRISLPLITHPGLWCFVSGSRKKGEKHIDAAYREINEETGIDKSKLRPLLAGRKVTIVERRKRIEWENEFFIFSSKAKDVKLNFENSAYKWVGISELRREKLIIDYFSEKEGIARLIGSFLAKS